MGGGREPVLIESAPGVLQILHLEERNQDHTHNPTGSLGSLVIDIIVIEVVKAPGVLEDALVPHSHGRQKEKDGMLQEAQIVTEALNMQEIIKKGRRTYLT